MARRSQPRLRKPALIGLGAGGHARVIIETLRLEKRWTLAGLLDPDPKLRGQRVLDVPVLGGDELLPELLERGVRHFFLGVGSVGDTSARRRLFQKAVACGLQPVDVIHPQAVVSASATLGKGVCAFAGAVINAQARLAENVIINTAAVVEHDCVIGAHVHVATGARLAGGVRVGEGSHVGLGASVLQGVRLGRQAIVGAGAVVLRDVPDGAVVVGVPARPLRPSASQSRASRP